MHIVAIVTFRFRKETFSNFHGNTEKEADFGENFPATKAARNHIQLPFFEHFLALFSRRLYKTHSRKRYINTEDSVLNSYIYFFSLFLPRKTLLSISIET